MEKINKIMIISDGGYNMQIIGIDSGVDIVSILPVQSVTIKAIRGSVEAEIILRFSNVVLGDAEGDIEDDLEEIPEAPEPKQRTLSD